MNPFSVILLIIQFWDIIKEIISMIDKMNPAQRQQMKARIMVANLLADQGDSTGLEDILNGK